MCGFGRQNGRIGGRVRRDLVAAAKKKSGITSDTELLEYALAKVALEDDFGTKLIRRKGRIAQDVDLDVISLFQRDGKIGPFLK
jgi:hypothetical protein